jgi:hypothetical protein
MYFREKHSAKDGELHKYGKMAQQKSDEGNYKGHTIPDMAEVK